MNYQEELIDLPDGRVLEVAAQGDTAGTTVFLHHGTPGSTRTLDAFAPLLDVGDFFIVTLSRPGYGRSSRLAGRNIAAVVEDARHVLDFFERDRYVALGWSGGGPHALACAALDAPRCTGAVTLASVVPIDVDFDWTEGMAPENVEEFALAKEGGPEFEEAMETTGTIMGDMTTENAVDIFAGLLSDPDRNVLSEDQALKAFVDATRHAFSESWRGYYDDNAAFYMNWGFDPRSIAVPVEIFYGDQDL
ncbi:MAG: alpha/beta hydrolase, partial [Acidimicrobiales bacterium]